MKIKLLIALLLGLLLFVACQKNQAVNTFTEEEEVTLFSEEDIDNAILQIADDVTVVPITVGEVIPDGEVISTNSNGEEDSLGTLLDVNNLSGYVCNIINNTNGRNKWRIQSINAADESVIGLFAVKQDGRAMQSIGCNAQGNKAVFSMKTSSSADYEVFLLDYTGSTRQAYQLTSNTKNDIDVSMSADGSVVVWQSWIGSDKVITVRQYAPDGTFSDTVLDGAVPYVEPSVNSEGAYVAFIDIQSSQTNLLKHDLATSTTTVAYTTSGKRSLAHPSISNDGNRVAWMDGADDENFKVKDLSTNAITEIVTNNPSLDHGFLADDGNSVVYSINRDDKAFTKVKNVDDGTTKNIGRVLSPPARYRGSSWVSRPWKMVSAGDSHTCALTSTGKAYCWGWQGNGRLGDNQIDPLGVVSIPKSVLTPNEVERWRTIDASSNTICAISVDNQLYCWGANSEGTIGDGTTIDRAIPTKVINPVGVTGWKEIGTGYILVCGITTDNQAYCWGGANNGAAIGDGVSYGTTLPTNKVVNPVGVTGWKKTASADTSRCLLANNNQVYCWGSDSHGALGDGNDTREDTLVPSLVINPTDVSNWLDVFAGSSSTCAKSEDNQLYCWGYNFGGVLGIGDGNDGITNPASFVSTPTKVINPIEVNHWEASSDGHNHVCSIGDNKQAYCWGDNSGKLGDGELGHKTIPTQVVNPSSTQFWRSVTSGFFHSCGISNNNKLYCWGNNDAKQLGNDTVSASLVPILVNEP